MQALGAILPPGPFDGSPVLCYAQKPLAAATLQDTSMDCMESGHPMGQNLVIMVSPFGGCNQNDSIVLNQNSVQRGLGCSLSYHTTRFDIHHPYRLFTGHPDIHGGLGVVMPGQSVTPGCALLAAQVPQQSNDTGAEVPEQEPMVRCAKQDDIGVVHRVVITSGNEGYVLSTNGYYNLHSWSPVKQEHVRLSNTTTDPITVRITTVSLREPRIGDKFASRHGQAAPYPYEMDMLMLSKGNGWKHDPTGRSAIHY